ncbi:MAG: 23S rRNA (uracil(1939)-C(5))-methyltransferase RlmD [Clostridia bacterium]|nr:23S rRNA (uracil(1939)-C(5))-methyltransferase RlmD [Clostridia bacterium]
MERILITGAGSEMQGVGRLADGRAAFVPGALPGEIVEIEIAKDAARFCEARLLRVVQPSPDRAEPACPHYGVCGGCSAQHMNYQASLRLKRQRVYDALQRIGGVENPLVGAAIGCENPERCRNKAEYAVSFRDGRLLIGSFEAKSRRIVPLKDCMLQHEASICALSWVQAELPKYSCAGRIRFLVTRVNRAGEMVAVFCADAPVQEDVRRMAKPLMEAVPEVKSLYFCKLNFRPAHALDGACSHIAGSKTMVDELLGLRFELSPQSFFQVNPAQAEKLYLKALEAAGLHENCDKRVLDAYCGAGTITLAAARLAKHATGVEIVPPAIENARQNAKRNGLEKKTRFICADAAKEIPKLISAGERFDAAIIDPPRKGADAALIHALADAKIDRISYVSCNPSTLARDVKIFRERGYRLEWAQPVDMFPWTEHVETAALLVRN